MPIKTKLVGGLLFVVVAWLVAVRVRSELILRPLLEEKGGRDDEGPGTPQDPATFARWHRFDTIWQTRSTRNVTQQIVPFLQDPFIPLRERAIHSLGELEDPNAEPALRGLLAQINSKNASIQLNGLSVLALKLALGRIHSHNLHGQAKVNAVVEPMGLTWGDVVKLFHRVNALYPTEGVQTEGSKIVDFVVVLLVSMADRGEDIGPLVKQLSLSPSQQLLLQVAPLPTDQEVNLLLKSFSHFNILVDRWQISNRLVELRPRSTDLLIRYLQDANAHPQHYRNISVETFSVLFYLATEMEDARVPPLLKKFEASPKPWPDLRGEAQKAEELEKVRTQLLKSSSSL